MIGDIFVDIALKAIGIQIIYAAVVVIAFAIGGRISKNKGK